MKAGDVKCPQCGTGLKDVAPDYEFGRATSTFIPLRDVKILAHCHRGHRVGISWTGAEDDDVVTVEARP